MANTRTFDTYGYLLAQGRAAGASEKTFRLQTEKKEVRLSLIELPLVPETKADFLNIIHQPQIGSVSGSALISSRRPWWSVMSQFERCGSSDGLIQFEDVLGNRCETSIRSVFSDVFRHAVAPHFNGSYVFTIPNYWEENEQEKFLQFLPCNRNQAFLLWQPVAITLACLKDQIQGSAKSLSGKSVLVLDFGNNGVEATRIRLRTDKGYSVPVRQCCNPSNSMRWSYTPLDWSTATALKNSLPATYNQSLLLNGVASRVLAHQKSINQQFIVGNAGAYYQIDLSSSERDALLEEVLTEPMACKSISKLSKLFLIDFDQMYSCVAECLRTELVSWIKKQDLPDIVVISGSVSDVKLEDGCVGNWIERHLLKALPSLKQSKILLADKGAASIGALLYGQREQLGLPTYFDVLPKYEVYVMQRVLGEMPRVGATTLVDNAEVRGGEVWKPKKPIDGFSIRALSSKFELFVRRENEDWTVIPADEFAQLEQDEPVLIYPEMRPASGFAVVTIRPKDNTGIFGKKDKLVLNWDKRKEKNPEPASENFAYPFVEWTEGRLAESTEVEYYLRKFTNELGCKTVVLNEGQIEYLEHKLEPYRIDQTNYREAYRGAFGNRRFQHKFDQKLVQELGQALMDCLKHTSTTDTRQGGVRQKTIKLLGFMYYYAPRDFRSYLVKRLESGLKPTDNELIAAGRVFASADQLNALLRYYCQIDDIKPPNLGWIYWAIFRCLIYYPETAMADRGLLNAFYKKAQQYLDFHKEKKIAFSSAVNTYHGRIRFCLFAILYGLRAREVNASFLPSKMLKDLIGVVDHMKTDVGFLQGLLSSMPSASRKRAEELKLNGITSEFLRSKATKATVDLLADLTKTIK